MPKRWPIETKDKAVQLYLDGVKYEHITAETGVPMATIIYWLHERGIQPNRREKASGDVTVDQLLTRLAESERKRGAAEARIRQLEAQLSEFLDVTEVTS